MGGQRPTDLLVSTNCITKSPAGQEQCIVFGTRRPAADLMWRTLGGVNPHSGFPSVCLSPLVNREQARGRIFLYFLSPSFLYFSFFFFFLKTYYLISAKKIKGKPCAHIQVRNDNEGLVYPKGQHYNTTEVKDSLPPKKAMFRKKAELPGLLLQPPEGSPFKAKILVGLSLKSQESGFLHVPHSN